MTVVALHDQAKNICKHFLQLTLTGVKQKSCAKLQPHIKSQETEV